MSRKKPNISECDLSKIGGRFAYVRLYHNLSQDEFSDKTGLSNGNISGIENHKYEPSYRALIKILEVFGVSSDWLLTGMGDMIHKNDGKSDNEACNNVKIISFGPVIEDHIEIVKKFKDNESALLASKCLINIEKKSPKEFNMAVGYLKGVSDSLDRQTQDIVDRRKSEIPHHPDRRKQVG